MVGQRRACAKDAEQPRPETTAFAERLEQLLPVRHRVRQPGQPGEREIWVGGRSQRSDDLRVTTGEQTKTAEHRLRAGRIAEAEAGKAT